MPKKIAIITHPCYFNYGGVLQCYALQEALRENGLEATVLNRRFRHSRYKDIKTFVWRVLHCIHHMEWPNNATLDDGTFATKCAETRKFMQANIATTPPIYSSRELREKYGRGYDTYIVGSDQVWASRVFASIGLRQETFFLDFVEDKGARKIAYAASFGSTDQKSRCYPEEERLSCGRLYGELDAVSVREKSGIEVIGRLGWQNSRCTPAVVLDPTLLLKREVYEGLCRDTRTKREGKYILKYQLDKSGEFDSLLGALEEALGMKSYAVMDTERWQDYDYEMPAIEEWLAGFRDASFVVTDSFHGMVFSIIFRREFAVYVNKGRGASRFLDLLGDLGLSDRIVEERSQVGALVKRAIDWDGVEQRLEERRRFSLDYLLKNI